MDNNPASAADPVSSSSASLSPSLSPSRSPNPDPNPTHPNGTLSMNSSPSHDDLQGDDDDITPTLAASSAPIRSSRRVPPPCWSVEEVIALIDSYQEKWYDLRRGNLRASHWQEVADAVNRRCVHHAQPQPPQAGSSASTRKTALQCRHKMEKLRKRYRAEMQKSIRMDPRSPPASSWEFFRKMDAMERGGAGAGQPAAPGGHRASRPGNPAVSPPSSDESSASSDDEDLPTRVAPPNNYPFMTNGGSTYHATPNPFGGDMRSKFPKPSRPQQFPTRHHHDDDEEKQPSRYHTTPRLDNIFARESGLLRRDYPEKPRAPSGLTEVRKRVEKKRKEAGKGMGEVAAALRMLGEGLVRMERMKMDMDMELHKARMETELRLTESMLQAQREIVETLFGGRYKRARVSPR